MGTYVFSPSRLAFYPEALRDVYESGPDGWPADGVQIDAEAYAELRAELDQGRVICADVNGRPATRLPDPPTAARLAEIERAWRDRQLSATDALVLRHRDELETGGTTLTDERYEELQAYRRELREWPEQSAFPLTLSRPTAPEWLSAEMSLSVGGIKL